jgi:hypothetical protein
LPTSAAAKTAKSRRLCRLHAWRRICSVARGNGSGGPGRGGIFADGIGSGSHAVLVCNAVDASFARTGACIGIVSSSNGTRWRAIAVHNDDYIAGGRSTKARAIAKAVRQKKFYELDRRLRQELVAIDGATIISHEGDLLAVGTILKIPGGSAGGGRLAAARALGNLGLGIKVSQDGGIVGFHYRYRNLGLKEAFRIM